MQHGALCYPWKSAHGSLDGPNYKKNWERLHKETYVFMSQTSSQHVNMKISKGIKNRTIVNMPGKQHMTRQLETRPQWTRRGTRTWCCSPQWKTCFFFFTSVEFFIMPFELETNGQYKKRKGNITPCYVILRMGYCLL